MTVCVDFCPNAYVDNLVVHEEYECTFEQFTNILKALDDIDVMYNLTHRSSDNIDILEGVDFTSIKDLTKQDIGEIVGCQMLEEEHL